MNCVPTLFSGAQTVQKMGPSEVLLEYFILLRVHLHGVTYRLPAIFRI